MQSFLVFAPSFPELGKSSQQFDKYEIQSLKIEKKIATLFGTTTTTFSPLNNSNS